MNRCFIFAIALCIALPSLARSQPVDTDPVTATAADDAPAPAPQTASDESSNDPELSARGRYNLALEHLQSAALEQAAEVFLAARDEAGPDPELRYRAAFNLGLTLAAQADAGQQENPEQAITNLRNSAAWFNDATRLAPPGDDDARINLELVLRRIQQLADQINQGHGLEAKLDRLIDDQRGLRDRIRRLLTTIQAQGASAEPVGFQREFDELATFERTLLADAGNVADLAGEERAGIDNKTDEERTQEETVRAFQLQSLEHFLGQARQALSDARRRLRRLEGERAHRRADAGLAMLKRAREQLVDPVTVLKSIARDEQSVWSHTQALANLHGGGFTLTETQVAPQAPAWLTADHLGERQARIADRSAEILARMQAAIQAPQAEAAQGQASDPATERMLKAAAEAVPFLESAVAAMGDAQSRLGISEFTKAASDERDALTELSRAIERFAGLRDLIELAYTDQNGVTTLLDPDTEAADVKLTTAERSRAIASAVARNLDRMRRLDALLEEEREKSLAGPQQPGADPGQSPPADPEQTAAVNERFDLAQSLRQQTIDSLTSLRKNLKSSEGDLLGPAKTGVEKLEELRRLFFNLIEHMKELLADQTRTHDDTASLGLETEIEKLLSGLGLAAERQAQHAGMAGQLASTLAQQADQMAASPEGNAGDQAQQAERMTKATEELRSSAGRMQSAAALVSDAGHRAQAMSPHLEPILGEQISAMEHLENAIALLQPPQDQDQDQDQDQQQQDQQQEEEMSQRQAARRLQAIRDREAERQRQRERQVSERAPVEKDW